MRSRFLLRLFQDVNVSKKKLWPELESDEVWESLVKADPTYVAGSGQRGKYLPWIVKQLKYTISKDRDFRNVNTLPQDWPNFFRTFVKEVYRLLSIFDKALKAGKLPNEYRDIHQIKSLGALETILDDFELGVLRTPTEIIKEDTDLLWTDGNWKLYRVNTYEASRLLGTGTNWCTSADSEDGRNYFEEYKDQYGGDYYIIMRGQKDIQDKYFLHKQSGQVRGWDQDNISNWFEDNFVENGPPLKDKVPLKLIQALVDVDPAYLYLVTQEEREFQYSLAHIFVTAAQGDVYDPPYYQVMLYTRVADQGIYSVARAKSDKEISWAYDGLVESKDLSETQINQLKKDVVRYLADLPPADSVKEGEYRYHIVREGGYEIAHFYIGPNKIATVMKDGEIEAEEPWDHFSDEEQDKMDSYIENYIIPALN